MSELIKITKRRFAAGEIETADARALHAYLEVGRDFSNWIKDRIQQYGFVEGVDYVTAQSLSTPNSASSKTRRQRTVEYHITLDMAKELAMVERNEKGKQARQYFIECERAAKSANLIAERQLVRKDSKSANRVMNGMVEMVREDQGKTCASHHYSNEVLMLYEILFGERKAIDRDELSLEDLNKLIKLETRNAILIGAGHSYADRKEKLREYAKRLPTNVPMLKAPKERRV